MYLNDVCGRSFVSTWRVDSQSRTLKLTLLQCEYAVTWGDGTVDRVLNTDGKFTQLDNPDANLLHTYARAGDYDVKIVGDISACPFFPSPSNGQLVDVKRWGWVSLHSPKGQQFKDCKVLIQFSAANVPLAAIANIQEMFSGCTQFKDDLSVSFVLCPMLSYQ